MITQDQARQIARAALDEFAAKHGVEVAIFDGEFGTEGVVEHADFWVIRWNSVEYLRTGNFLTQILIGPIAVPKNTNGDGVYYVLGTSGTETEELDTLRTQLDPTRRTRFYRSYIDTVTGDTMDMALFRRESPDSLRGDAVFERDGNWHFTADLARTLDGHTRERIREIDPDEALRVIVEGFKKPATALHAPMTITRPPTTPQPDDPTAADTPR